MAIAVAPSCPLHVGVLDSPDYWTDEALASAVRPLSGTNCISSLLALSEKDVISKVTI